MALNLPMPAIQFSQTELKQLATGWNAADVELPKSQGEALGHRCDEKVASALASMLNGIAVVASTSKTALLPAQDNCVEHGHINIIGGIRPQNFDVAYRPDGVRFAYDSKTLNSLSSVAKNYRNMINDLGTEAATVHTRFPFAVVGFLVAVPEPCLNTHRENMTAALHRLTGRILTSGDLHRAEAIALVAWDPVTGTVSSEWPPSKSILRIERFSKQVEAAYVERYAGLPPHD